MTHCTEIPRQPIKCKIFFIGTILILYYLLIYYFNAIEKYIHYFFSGGGGELNDNDLTLVTQQQHLFYVHTETDNILISLLTLATLAAFYADFMQMMTV